MPSRKQIQILIVEDDPDLRRFYMTALQQLGGFDVRQSGDGYKALQSIDADPPDLVILDLDLPTIDGYSVQEEITARTHMRHIPIVVVTGFDADLDRLDVACVLRKPVTADKLLETVRRCLATGLPRATS